MTSIVNTHGLQILTHFKISFFINLVLLLSCSVIHAQNQPIQKYNLNFNEVDSTNQILPNGWFLWGSEKSEKFKVSDDNYGAVVTSNKKGKFGSIAYRIPANFKADSITLTGKIKFKDVENYTGMIIRLNDSNGDMPLAFTNMNSYNLSGTRDWKEYSVTLPYFERTEDIYVAGLLSGKGTAWFDDFRVTLDGVDIQTLKYSPKLDLKDYDLEKLKASFKNSAIGFDFNSDSSLDESFDTLIEEIGNKKIVAIGESTHGTSEFYKLRSQITKRLIEEKGFNIVILENPYDEILELNNNLFNEPLKDLMKDNLFSIYQTKEMETFLNWYKDNKKVFDINFKGCDDSYWSSLDLLEEYLVKSNDENIIALYNKLSKLISNNSKNYRKRIKNGSEVHNTIIELEEYLTANDLFAKDLEELLFNIKTSYINYFHLNNKNKIQSRDEIMALRIAEISRDENARIIVWAHNAHISENLIVGNEIGAMGNNLAKQFGDDYHTIALTTHGGSYSYINGKFINGDSKYDEKLNHAEITESDRLLWENLFHDLGSSFYLSSKKLSEEIESDELLGFTKFIGYSKESDEDIYKVKLLNAFDTVIFIDFTTATKQY